ncbi:Methylthioribose-1-phosphate isomerase [Frankliniella fusca]|uniref:Methylthioribose-1-phosphate isomerase n=1 Tax=Frankliniella fusca TaxID=407009 RepID=A0AAE1H9S2_9NEOP|nr:Methylthioribose-1-phosphate isomerase [Frankliniella fusca]
MRNHMKSMKSNRINRNPPKSKKSCIQCNHVYTQSAPTDKVGKEMMTKSLLHSMAATSTAVPPDERARAARRRVHSTLLPLDTALDFAMTSPASRGQRLALMAIDNYYKGSPKPSPSPSPVKLHKLKRLSPSKKTHAKRRLILQPADMPISEIERSLGLSNWDTEFVNSLIGESSERLPNNIEQSSRERPNFLGIEFLENVNNFWDQPQPLTGVLCSTPFKSDDTSSFVSLTPLVNDPFLNNTGDVNNNPSLDETALLQSAYSSDLLSSESYTIPTDPSTGASPEFKQQSHPRNWNAQITRTENLLAILIFTDSNGTELSPVVVSSHYNNTTYDLATGSASYYDCSEQSHFFDSNREVTGDTENILDHNATTCEQSPVLDPVSDHFESPAPTNSSPTANASQLFRQNPTPEVETVNTEKDQSVDTDVHNGDHDSEHNEQMDGTPIGPNPKPKTQQQLKLENKQRRDRGEEYLDTKGNLVPKKKPKTVECKCQFKLCKTLTEAETLKLNEAYWGLGNYSRQRDYINKCMKCIPVKRHSTGASNPRSNTFEYWFPVSREGQDVDIRVCRAKFLGVLDIGKKTLVCTKQNEKNGFSKKDQRGKHAPSHKINPAQHAAVVEHISSFLKVESHYCRQSSSFQYLDQKLSIRLMHKLFKHGHDPKLHVGYETYRKIFKKDFHLSFHKPKKDQCSTCANFRNLSDEQKALRAEDQARHLKNKDLARNEKSAHKQEALENDSFKSFTFDLQSVLYTPCSEVSSFYYSRKLNCYNFTIYDQGSREGVCYFWDETEGERGTSEIGTALWTHLLTLPEKVKKLCKDFLIPEEFHDYYNNLPCNGETVERLAEPDAMEEDEDGPSTLPNQDGSESDNEL